MSSTIPIASFNARFVLPRMITLGAMMIAVDTFFLASVKGETFNHLMITAPFLVIPELFSFIFVAFSILFIVVAVKRMLFEHGKAIWVEGGRVIFFHRRAVSVPCQAIAEVRVGVFGKPEKAAIIIRRRNGGDTIIPALALQEPADVVLARLKSALQIRSGVQTPGATDLSTSPLFRALQNAGIEVAYGVR